MATAMASIDSKKQICRDKLETIGHYLLLHNVSNELRTKILEYFEYRYTSSQSMVQDLNLLRDLPPSLATRLALMMNHRVVVRSAHFFSALSDQALLGVLQQLKPAIFVPQEVIVVEAQILKAVHFIRKGKVRSFTAAEPAGRILEGGDSFGLEGVESLIHQAAAGGDPSKAAAGSTQAVWNRLSPRALKVVHSHHTCIAVTYCDLMSLALHELSELLARETSWAELGAQPPKEALSSFRRASRLFSKMGNLRKSRSSSSDDAQMASPPGAAVLPREGSSSRVPLSQHAVSFATSRTSNCECPSAQRLQLQPLTSTLREAPQARSPPDAPLTTVQEV